MIVTVAIAVYKFHYSIWKSYNFSFQDGGSSKYSKLNNLIKFKFKNVQTQKS